MVNSVNIITKQNAKPQLKRICCFVNPCKLLPPDKFLIKAFQSRACLNHWKRYVILHNNINKAQNICKSTISRLVCYFYLIKKRSSFLLLRFNLRVLVYL